MLHQIRQEIEKIVTPLICEPVAKTIPLIKNQISEYCKTIIGQNNEWIDIIIKNNSKNQISYGAGNIRTQLLMMGYIEDIWLCPVNAITYKTKTGLVLNMDAQTKEVYIIPEKPLKYINLNLTKE